MTIESLAVSTSTHALSILPDWLDPNTIIPALGPYALLGVCLIIFAECGLLIGFFLPGDSLLFVTGMFVGSGLIEAPVWMVCVAVAVCAFVGNVTGYWIGKKVGPALFNKPDSKLFKHEHVEKTHEFFEKYGATAVILARFVPIVRTFITAVAGVGQMDQRKFFTYSAIGALLWAAGMTVLGFFLGNIPWIEQNIDTVAILIVLISVLPLVVGYVKERRQRTRSLAS